MKYKFDETFQILDSGNLKYCINEMNLEGVWPSEFRKCIVGLELLRRDEYIDAFIKLDDNPAFDMIVVDEAHHISNPLSKSHAIIEYFCRYSENVVFLSATPLQLGNGDLFSLLNVLDPEEFIDCKVFNQMVQPNSFINKAMRYVRDASDQEWKAGAINALEHVFINDWAVNNFIGNHKYNYWLNELKSSDDFSDEKRVECLKDLESLHTLSHIINRTKRKDIGEFTLREPVTVYNKFSQKEKSFYESVVKFENTLLRAKYGPIVAGLVMSTIERQITSCIPAFITMLDQFLARGLISVDAITDDMDMEDINIRIDDDFNFISEAKNIKTLSLQLPQHDNKLEKLIEIIKDTKDNCPAGKLLIFSFFKNTLYYLKKQLQEINILVELITGDTSAEDREIIRDRFRMDKDNENAINVLLCSEVGCEGLDYEFCSRMVNYDIPWNPMKIEQRIGRIDRFGQKSKKIQIYNFITEGTVEEKVFFRCFERLGIFNSTVGDFVLYPINFYMGYAQIYHFKLKNRINKT